MQIYSINQLSALYNNNRNYCSIKNNNTLTHKTPFSGHYNYDVLLKNGENRVLIQQTALFRDLKTKKFVTDYILKNFHDKPEIKMLIGACSTGEEAFTYAMLLNSLKSKLSITGFDLSHNGIERAQSGQLIMQGLKDIAKWKMYSSTWMPNDFFLCFQTDEPLNEEQLEQKRLFDDFFEIIEKNYEPKLSWKDKLNKWLVNKIIKIPIPEYENKIIKVRDGKFKNCDFKEGDILNLTEVTEGRKADVITFSNALYHLTTTNITSGMYRLQREDKEKNINLITDNIIENLNPNGLFVLGENESKQMLDSTTVPQILTERGFRALYKPEESFPSVWKLEQ